MRLTQTVQKGGCAAKVAAAELRKILSQVSFPPTNDQVLVDGSTFDDSAVFQISETLAMVQTLDFFTPIVDDPYDFGRVAAANSLSDIYAMGSKPKTSLAILAFPLANMETSIIQAVLQGASDQIKLSQSFFLGGHSIDDDTLKFGLSVTGLIHPNKIWSNAKARVGDKLILTKGLGTGTLTAALKQQALTDHELKTLIESMAQLNNVMDYLSESELENIHACTDITGFGLMGHALHIAKASQVGISIDYKAIPFLPGVFKALETRFLTKAHRTNKEYTANSIDMDSKLTPIEELTLFDPQTSGGLLLSVDPIKANKITDQLKIHFPSTSIIGEITSTTPEKIRILK